MKLPRISVRHRGAIYFLLGIGLGLCAVFLVVKDRFTFLNSNDRVRIERQAEAKQPNSFSKQPLSETKQPFNSPKYRFAPFNPNTVSRERLLEFGLSERQVSNIINYRDKSGGFRDEAHFRRLYCMTDELFSQIQPYLIFDFKKETEPSSARTYDLPTPKAENSLPKREVKSLVLDLNHSDSLDLQQIKGIGRVRAARIYHYGKKLGGYVSVEQLKEVYGITDSLFEQLKPHFKVENPQISKVNVNSDEVKYLAAHPYIDFPLAKALIRFRKEYKRDFQKPDEIRYIHLLSEQEYEKLLPYIDIK